MKRLFLVMALSVLLAPTPGVADMVGHVDPFIGTGGHGHTFPGPTLPFGMVQLSPDTRLTGWDGCSGYHADDRIVYGFSHTHLSGTGVSDYGDILLMPVTGEPHLVNGYPDQVDQGYGSRFSKATEHAAAGWYAVHLDDYDIDVELTATLRTGLHRYVFPAGKAAHIIIDLAHRDKLLDADMQLLDDGTVLGFRQSQGWAQNKTVYFQAAFSRPVTGTQFVTDEEDRVTKAVLSFGNSGGEVVVQVGISSVDRGGAVGNLKEEWVNFDFTATKAKAHEAWAAQLNRFTVEGASDNDQTILATALYHSFIAPNLFSDADGRYRNMGQEVGYAQDRNQYTVFSLWDTYRATHPFFTLVERARTGDFINTMIDIFNTSGRLPVWELAANETNCMIGYHAVSVMADAYLKGIGGFEPSLAINAMLTTATGDDVGLDDYLQHGFISADQESESVSKTLEYAYDDDCIAKMATAMGWEDSARQFAARAQSWRHLYDPVSRCFRPRRNGQWLKPFDPRRVDNNYTEANAWQYRFAVPQAIADLQKLYGDSEAFTAVLDSMFTTASATTGRDQADITGLMGQYAHGNEPSHHIAWLYHTAGHPQKTADRVGKILTDFYTAAPDGLIGNEDCGQMSSWYVLSAYGIYDAAPGDGIWCVIPPRFPTMTMHFEDGRAFTTRRQGQGAIASVTWNGEPLTRSYLTHAELVAGGELVFQLGEPGTWGQAVVDRPLQALSTAKVEPAPWASAASDRFRGSMPVTLVSRDSKAKIYWTADENIAPRNDHPYDGPITLTETTTLRFVAVGPGGLTSPVVSATFVAMPHDWTVTLGSVPNGQYTAGGPDALIDGVRGDENWRTGNWQGYQGQDFIATVNFPEPEPVFEVGAEFLQDVRSWILMPTELQVEVSTDGETFTVADVVTNEVPADEEDSFTQELLMFLDGSPLKAIRFTARNYGRLPEWHPGAGGEAFIFVDELIIE